MEEDREEQLLNDIYVHLTYNTIDNKYTWIGGHHPDFEDWERVGDGVIFRALFEGGPAKAIRGFGIIRHFEQPDERRNIYIYIPRGHELEDDIELQLFVVSVGDGRRGVIVQGTAGVVRELDDLFRDDYDTLYERQRAHRVHMLDFEGYLGRLDRADGINPVPVVRNNRRMRDEDD
jgi:hypothetical protein